MLPGVLDGEDEDDGDGDCCDDDDDDDDDVPARGAPGEWSACAFWLGDIAARAAGRATKPSAACSAALFFLNLLPGVLDGEDEDDVDGDCCDDDDDDDDDDDVPARGPPWLCALSLSSPSGSGENS